MTQKVECEGCGTLILPTTSRKTGGYCIPCCKYGPPPQKSLVELKIIESPDHEIINKPWLLDVRYFKCEWKNYELTVYLELSNHEQYVSIKFSDVKNLKVGEIQSAALKIKHVGKNFPDLPKIRVEGNIEFWAGSVEMVKNA